MVRVASQVAFATEPHAAGVLIPEDAPRLLQFHNVFI